MTGPTTRRDLCDDQIISSQPDLEDVVKYLPHFKPGEYWEKPFQVGPQAGTKMDQYVTRLRDEGLDIGKGDSQFGYKMPLPEPDVSTRYLQIFRRS